MLFDERMENAKRILIDGHLSNSRTILEGAYVVRYLRFIGRPEYEIRKTLEKMFKEKYYVPSRPDMSKYYDASCSAANRIPPVRTDSIYISKGQLEVIKSINNPDIEKLVFCAVCIYQYYFNDRDMYIVKLKDAMKVSGTTFKQIQCFLRCNDFVQLRQFRDVHYLDLSEKLLQNYDDDGITIDNTINLCYYYDKWAGYGYFKLCQNCGCIIRQKSNNVTYCKICANRIKLIQVRNIKRKQRANRNKVDTINKTQ